MKKIVYAALLLLFTSLTLLPDPNTDFTMVEKCLEWMKYIKSGADRTDQERYFNEHISPTSGADSIIRYWESISAQRIPGLSDYFYRLLKGRISAEKPDYEFITKEWYARSGKLLRRMYDRPDFYEKVLSRLKTSGIRKNALSLALECLPGVDLMDIKVEFIVFGHSLAFSVGDRCVYDFLQLPVDKKGNINVNEVVQTLGHEIHHLGFERISKERMRSVFNLEKLTLIWLLSSEGIPTYYIDRPHEMIGEYRKRSDVLYKMIASDWDRHRGNLNNLYREAANDIELGLKGDLSLSAVTWKWNEGVKGAVYVLGSDMISVIDEFLGKDAVKEVVFDYRKLIGIYNRAADKGNLTGRDYYVFSRGLARKIMEFRE